MQAVPHVTNLVTDIAGPCCLKACHNDFVVQDFQPDSVTKRKGTACQCRWSSRENTGESLKKGKQFQLGKHGFESATEI
jgi:hypothetical protein